MMEIGDVLTHLWDLTQRVLDDARPPLDGLGLYPKAFFLLSAVEAHPFPAEIARRMNLPSPTVTYIVKQMEEKGYLIRQSEPEDLRKFRLLLTVEGREAVRQGWVAINHVFGRRLDHLNERNIDEFDRLLVRLIRSGEPSADPVRHDED